MDLFTLRMQLHGYEDRVLEGRAAAAFTKVLHVMQVCAPARDGGVMQV